MSTTLAPQRPAKLHKAKPVVEDLSGAAEFTLTDHAIAQMQARNVGLAEVFSTIVDPDQRRTRGAEEVSYVRGDVRVVVNPVLKVIVTVIDLDEDARALPRIPLNAPPAKKGVKARLDLSKPVEKVKERLPESDEIEWLLGHHDTEDIRFIDVSPVIAEKLLTLNVRNRPKRPKDSEDWADQIVEGRWLTTHQGVALDRNRVIVDGQHRLEAIVASGQTVRMAVAVGLAPEVFDVIDTGRKRSARDVLAMRGEVNVASTASVVRMIHAYDNSLISRRIKGLVHNDELAAYFEERAEAIREAVRIGARCANTFHGKRTPFAVGFYLLYRDVPQLPLVDEFLAGLLVGAELKVTDARWVLRRQALNLYGSRDKRYPAEQLALLLKGWAAFVQDRPIRTLGWRKDETMPEVYLPTKEDLKARGYQG